MPPIETAYDNEISALEIAVDVFQRSWMNSETAVVLKSILSILTANAAVGHGLTDWRVAELEEKIEGATDAFENFLARQHSDLDTYHQLLEEKRT